MKQKFNDILDHSLTKMAVLNCFDAKWRRDDTVLLIGKYAGVQKAEILRQMLKQEVHYQLEAADGIGWEMENRIEACLDSHDPEDLELAPVVERVRTDGLSRKTRVICLMDPLHQLLGHIVYLGMKPMLQQKLFPGQHASIPGHGQVRLKVQTYKLLRRHNGIKHAVKADIRQAYGSTTYDLVLYFLKQDLPDAHDLHIMIEVLGELAPGGHLIIGGYLDAWLFNYVMSHIIEHLLSLTKVKRGKQIRLVKSIQTYMDDTAVFGGRLADLKAALRETGRWMEPFGLRWKEGFEVITFLPLAEELRRKQLKAPSKRGCPGIDMAGYVMHRSFITIRPRVFKNVRRAYIRAERRRRQKRPLSAKLARRVCSYFGQIKQSTGKTLRRKYHVKRVKKLASAAVSYYDREHNRRVKEAMKAYA